MPNQAGCRHVVGQPCITALPHLSEAATSKSWTLVNRLILMLSRDEAAFRGTGSKATTRPLGPTRFAIIPTWGYANVVARCKASKNHLRPRFAPQEQDNERLGETMNERRRHDGHLPWSARKWQLDAADGVFDESAKVCFVTSPQDEFFNEVNTMNGPGLSPHSLSRGRAPGSRPACFYCSWRFLDIRCSCASLPTSALP